MPRFHLQGSIGLSALLLASLPAQAREWDLQGAIASAQVVRGLAYIDQPLAELAGSWSTASGWSAGASAAGALHAPQRAAAASVGYGWPLAERVDAYVALSRAAYRREGGWRLRYDGARVSVNLHDRLFLALDRTFHVRGYRPPAYGTVHAPGGGYGSGILAKEAVWRQPLPHGLTLMAGAGHAAPRGTGGLSYWYGSVGVRAVLGRAELEATWIDSESAAESWWGSQAGQRWVGSVRWNF